jgi:hypothetical protein
MVAGSTGGAGGVTGAGGVMAAAGAAIPSAFTSLVGAAFTGFAVSLTEAGGAASTMEVVAEAMRAGRSILSFMTCVEFGREIRVFGGECRAKGPIWKFRSACFMGLSCRRRGRGIF